MSELSEGTGIAVDDGLRKRIQDSIYRVLSYQSYSGSFGLWSPGSGDLWLDSYVTDFLTRARELKYDVPKRPWSRRSTTCRTSRATIPTSRKRVIPSPTPCMFWPATERAPSATYATMRIRC